MLYVVTACYALLTKSDSADSIATIVDIYHHLMLYTFSIYIINKSFLFIYMDIYIIYNVLLYVVLIFAECF